MTKPDRLRTTFLLLVLIGALVVVRPLLFASPSERLTRAAARALSREQWPEATKIAKRALTLDPENPEAMAIAGIACSRQHLDDEALSYLTQTSNETKITRLAVQRELGRRYAKLGRLMDTEECYREVLSIDADDFEANRGLARLLSFEGRCSEAAPHLLAQMRNGIFLADELYLLGIPDEIVLNDQHLLERSQRNFPDDPLSQLGTVRILVADHKLAVAEPIVRRIVDSYPNLPLAQALLGRILVEQNRIDEALTWHRALTERTIDAPEVWFVRGLWARQSGQPEAAIRCLLETLRTSPSHVEANYQLSQLFQKTGETDHAEFFSERSLLLSQLGYVVNDLRGDPDLRLMQQAIDGFEKLGRSWEAVGWCHIANAFGGEDWAPQRLEQNRNDVCRDSGQVVAAANPLNAIVIEDYPLPDWSMQKATSDPLLTNADATPVQFSNVAERSGLTFQYFNSMDARIGLEHIFQTTGGGIAVLDVDGDLWPDVYFGNGMVLPDSVADINTPQSFHIDALYRNRGDGRFSLTTSEASLGDDRFSQGVTAGDFDNDGFQDIFVANVGRNRLYHNNGDGTFTETSGSGTTEANVWTMSAMIADIDGDGLSDLYAVNYLDMAEVFDRSCKNDGEPLTCAPTLFNAEQDTFYRNRGDGTFEDVTEAYGIAHPNGKGLGIVGLHVDGRHGLQLFIANDTTENLYYESMMSEGDSGYAENAVLAGLAMSESGDMQACMGVAAGDANEDGNIDLFVTNFFADSNTMYLQTIPGTFTDSTRHCALAEPSYGMVGFGTQFLDADLDGSLDLLVTNGHVDQTFATGEPDRMAAQFFRNLSAGQFAEQDAASLGPFFEQKWFGRALARLDWNRDGKDDACVVHLSAPVALLSNETQTQNKAIVVHLRGTSVSRDAIGTTVTLQTQDGRTFVRQLTGGDGYQASNEKKLTFGLPKDSIPKSLKVQWIDGTETLVTGKFDARELLILQGKGQFSL